MAEDKPRLPREAIAARVAAEIPPGAYVNLGIGMPTLVPNYVSVERGVVFHAENGVLGTGPSPEPGREIPDLVNAGGQLTTPSRTTTTPAGSPGHFTCSTAVWSPTPEPPPY